MATIGNMRYFLHMTGAVDLPDTEGYEFAGPSEACAEAIRSAGEYLRDRPSALCDGGDLTVEIRDVNDRKVFTLVMHIDEPLISNDNQMG